MKILTTAQMRQVEQECAKSGISTGVLMENAGKAVAEEVKRILGNIEQKRILLLIGPGNNGGDGLVAARHLHDQGAEISLYLFGQRASDDVNFRLVRERGITCVDAVGRKSLDWLDKYLSSAAAVIDAIFGTGKSRPLSDVFGQAVNKVKQAKERLPGLRIIALDLPSGLNADSGTVTPSCLYADNTITLGFPKPGLYQFPGAEKAGQVSVADIGIPSSLADYVNDELLTDKWVRSILPRRSLSANKGTFGRVLVAAGSINYIGAAYLACSGAMRVGAGRVTLAIASSLQPILASKLTEVTYLPLPETSPGNTSDEAANLIHNELKQYDVLLIGCGLGQTPAATRFVKSVLVGRKKLLLPLVLDADALNTLAKVRNWWQKVPDNAILTPHPGEMARLTGLSVEEVQSDRIRLSRKMAREWHKTVVLKGAYTVVASPEGRCCISPFANPGLASAGTGDVLSGVIAGLMAQGLSVYEAAAAGVYIHGKAGEQVRDRLGDTGMVAGDLLPELPLTIKRLKQNPAE